MDKAEQRERALEAVALSARYRELFERGLRGRVEPADLQVLLVLLLERSPVRVLVAAFATGAAGLALSGAAPVLAISVAGMAIAGAGRGLGDVAGVTLIQARATDEVRSRVFAAQDGAAHAAFSVSAFAGGLLVELAGARGAFATAAAFGVGAALLASRTPAQPRASG